MTIDFLHRKLERRDSQNRNWEHKKKKYVHTFCAIVFDITEDGIISIWIQSRYSLMLNIFQLVRTGCRLTCRGWTRTCRWLRIWIWLRFAVYPWFKNLGHVLDNLVDFRDDIKPMLCIGDGKEYADGWNQVSDTHFEGWLSELPLLGRKDWSF